MGQRLDRFVNHIDEKSYSHEDIPKLFKVVIDINPRYNKSGLEDVANMKLVGVKGISSSGDIAYQFMGSGSNALLTMNALDVISLNKLSKFMYDNPHYFLSDNMANLKRMYQKRIDDDRGTWHNLADYIFKEIQNRGIVDKFTMQMIAPGQSVSYTDAIKNNKVNSLRDAVRIFRMACEEILKEPDNAHYYRFLNDVLKLSDKEISDIITESFKKYIGVIYADEGEWIVKDGALNVPHNSYLYVLIDYTDEDIKDYQDGKWDAFQLMRQEDYIKRDIEFKDKIYKLGIDKKYNLKFINGIEWERIKKLHVGKRYNQ